MQNKYKIIFAIKDGDCVVLNNRGGASAFRFDAYIHNGYTLYYRDNGKLRKLFWEKNPSRYLR